MRAGAIALARGGAHALRNPFRMRGGGACPQRMGPRQIQAACVWSKWAGHAASDLWTCRIPRECSGSAVSSLCETEKGTTFSMSSGQKRRREWACSAREPRLRTAETDGAGLTSAPW